MFRQIPQSMLESQKKLFSQKPFIIGVWQSFKYDSAMETFCHIIILAKFQ